MNRSIHYGQVFLRRREISKKIIDASNIQDTDNIVEIGPGRGALTRIISKLKTASFVAIEIDPAFLPVNNRYRHIVADILKFDISRIAIGNNMKLISNLPYEITKKFFENLIYRQYAYFETAIIMLQYEMKDMFKYNQTAFSRFVNHYYIIEFLFDVPRTAFDPIPNCDSYVFRFIRKQDIKNLSASSSMQYYSFLKRLYVGKRKMLKNNLIIKSLISNFDIYNRIAILLDQRIEMLSEENIMKLYEEYCNIQTKRAG